VLKIFFISLIVILSNSFPVYSGEVGAEAVENNDIVTKEELAIPYKKSENYYSENSIPGFILLVFLVLIAVSLYFVKNGNRLNLSKISQDSEIKIVDVKRLNTKTTAFLIEVRNEEIMVFQSGDHVDIVKLAEKSNEST
jgi:hypothetical protein